MIRYSGSPALPGQQLISMAIHDLRTPVTAIKGFGQLALRRDGLHPASRTYLEMIVAEANRAAGYLDDLALLARLDEGEDVLLWRDTDLGEIAQTVARQAAGTPFAGVVRLADGPRLTVRCDPNLTARALVHLIRVAARHAGDAPVTLAPTRLPDGPAIVVAARVDPPVDLDEWAESAHTGRDQPARSGSRDDVPDDWPDGSELHLGTRGLGVYLAGKLVDAQGAQFWIDLPATGGARFHVIFPES